MHDHHSDSDGLGVPARLRRRRVAAVLVVAAALVVSVLSVTAPALTPTATATTYAGPFFPTQPGFRASADKPQSKLWFADGHWWGLLQRIDGQTAIHSLQPDHTWLATNAVVDTRSNSTADALYRGGKLYVASRVSSGPTYLSRFTDTAGVYTLDSGFPIAIAQGGSESVTLDRDSNGVLWATYTQGSKVLVTNSTAGNDLIWVKPYSPPVPDVTVTADDISGLVAVPGGIAVLWSDQQDGSFKFALHHDATNTWTNETAKAASLFGADDHINMKSFGTAQNGRLYVSVKTSNNDPATPSPGAPLLQLLTRSAAGNWSISDVHDISADVTRPIVMVDSSNSELYVCYAQITGATTSELRYKKAAATDAPVFPTGQGTVLARVSGGDINDPSGAKDPVTNATGLVVLGSDMTASRYYHTEMPIAAPPDLIAPTPPDTATASINISSQRAVDITWTASTDNVGVTGYQIFRDGGTVPIATTAATPRTYTDPGLMPSSTHTWSVAGVDAAGNVSAKRTTAPLTLPPDTTKPSAPGGLSATLSSSGPVTLTWSAATDDVAVTGYRVYRNDSGGVPIATTNASTLTYVNHGLAPSTAYTWTVTAVDAAGNESLPSNSAGVTTPPPSPPTAPTNLAVSSLSVSGVGLSWTASTDPNENLAGYQLVRDGTTLPGVVTATSAVDTPGDSQSHVYRVVAVDTDGHTSSVSSATVAPARDGAAFRSSTSAAGSGTTVAVGSAPAGLRPADALLATVVSLGNGTVTAPAGWTSVRTTTRGSSMRVSTFVQTVAADGSWAPASFTLSKSTSWTAVLQAWSGVRLTTPVLTSASATGTKATVTAPAVVAARSAAVLSLFAMGNNATMTTASPPLTVIGSASSATSWLAGNETATSGAQLAARTAQASRSGSNVGTRIVLAPAVTQP